MMSASNRINEKDICEHNMISLSRKTCEDTYDLHDLFKCCKFDLSMVPQRYINSIQGQSCEQYPISIWISDLIDGAEFSEKFSHVTHEVGLSVGFNLKLSPLLTSLDM